MDIYEVMSRMKKDRSALLKHIKEWLAVAFQHDGESTERNADMFFDAIAMAGFELDYYDRAYWEPYSKDIDELIEIARRACLEYENDPDLWLDKTKYTPYEYSEEKVNKYIQRQKDLNRRALAIMCGGEIVGEVIIKNIEDHKCATLGICLKNAKYKDQGIGTQAERLAVQYVFKELNIPVLYADSIQPNTRSQHVLEKVGFKYVNEDADFKYYRIDQEDTE